MANFRKSGLGKGLGALIPSDVGVESQSEFRLISVSKIRPNPKQPRKHFDEESLSGLASSISEVGVLQPILVSKIGEEEFELIAGERRWRAARRAGLLNIPALIQELDEIKKFENTLIENLHRDDLDPLEEAEGFSRLIEDYQYTHEMIAQRVGKSRAAITNSLRLLQLSPGVQNSIHLGQISAGHARALLGLNDRSLQEDIAKRIASDGLSVRETENLIKNITNPDDETNTTTEAVDDEISNKDENLTGTKMSNVRPPGLYELEALLAEKLSTSVKVQLNGKRGKVVIDFATLEDLERIYRLMFSQLT